MSEAAFSFVDKALEIFHDCIQGFGRMARPPPWHSDRLTHC